MKRALLLIAAMTILLSFDLFAQAKIDLQSGDTIGSVLAKNVGQAVELRMKSGEKIGGKVEKVGDKMVHLSQLTGAEFYEGAVDLTDIGAVIVRVKK